MRVLLCFARAGEARERERREEGEVGWRAPGSGQQGELAPSVAWFLSISMYSSSTLGVASRVPSSCVGVGHGVVCGVTFGWFTGLMWPAHCSWNGEPLVSHGVSDARPQSRGLVSGNMPIPMPTPSG